MASLTINLPDNIYERLEAESAFSGEAMESIIARSLTWFFSQAFLADPEEMPSWDE
jgi:hypothetical protein